MKNLFLLFITLICISITSNAQDISKNTIGLRLGDSDGFGAEITYQRAILENNRVELDFGWRNSKNYDGVKFVALYQWVWNLHEDFNWYVGAGAGLSAFKINTFGGNKTNDTFALAVGNIGIEYSFDIPLLLSLDFRPELGFGSDVFDNNDLDFDIGLGLRYQF